MSLEYAHDRDSIDVPRKVIKDTAQRLDRLLLIVHLLASIV
jgi:hypothetical protein